MSNENEEKALAIKQPGFINNIDELNKVADNMIKSGLFKDVQSMAQASVKIMAGQEYGIGPFAAMRSIHIIQGNATLAAGLMASKVKAHPKYDYRVKTLDDTGCIISFFENVEGKAVHLGDSKFDRDDAINAGLAGKDNWKKYPRNMYFSRAISNGVRFYCPDVFYGLSVYTPDEIDADWVDVEGVDVESKDMNQNKKVEHAQPKPTPKNSRPFAPEVLAEKFAQKVKAHEKDKAGENDRKKLIANLNQLTQGDDNLRHALTDYLCGTESTKDLDDANVLSLNDWLNVGQDSGGAFVIDGMAAKEYKRIVEEVFAEGDGK